MKGKTARSDGHGNYRFCSFFAFFFFFTELQCASNSFNTSNWIHLKLQNLWVETNCVCIPKRQFQGAAGGRAAWKTEHLRGLLLLNENSPIKSWISTPQWCCVLLSLRGSLSKVTTKPIRRAGTQQRKAACIFRRLKCVSERITAEHVLWCYFTAIKVDDGRNVKGLHIIVFFSVVIGNKPILWTYFSGG